MCYSVHGLPCCDFYALLFGDIHHCLDYNAHCTC